MSKKRKVYTGPIYPGKGIGEIRLGMTPLQVIRILGEPDVIKFGDELGLFTFQGMSIGFNQGVCHMIVAEDSTQPPDPSGVYIGMPWRELVKIHPKTEFDEGTELWRSPDFPGVWYRIVFPIRDGVCIESEVVRYTVGDAVVVGTTEEGVCDESEVVCYPNQSYVHEIYVMTEEDEDDS